MQVFLITVFILFVAFTFLDAAKAPTEIKIPAWIIMFLLLLAAASFRTGGNNDTEMYYMVFDDAPYRSELNKTETGYIYINYFFKLLGFNKYFFLSIFAAGSLFIMYRFFYRFTPFFLISTLIYFSHVFLLREMLQIRAGMAIGISMFALPYIHKRKFLATSFILVLASTIHSSSLFLFILYFLYPYFQTIRSYWFLLVAGLILGFFLDLNFFIWLAEKVGIFRLRVYVVDDRFTKGLGLLNPALIKHYLVLLVLFNNRELFEQKIPYFKVLLLSYVIAASWLAAFNAFDVLAGRVATLFSNVEHVLIPSFLLIPRMRLMYYIIIILYCIVAFYSNLQGVVALYGFDAGWLLP